MDRSDESSSEGVEDALHNTELLKLDTPSLVDTEGTSQNETNDSTAESPESCSPDDGGSAPPPIQCATPISIMYDFLAHHNLPCKYKPSFEQSARECLLALGEGAGDHEGWPDRTKVTSHSPRESRRKKKQGKRFATKGRDGGDLRHAEAHSSAATTDAPLSPQYLMTSDDVFARLAALLSPKLSAEGFGQWMTCQHLHARSVQDNIPDAGFYSTTDPGRCGGSRRSSAVLYNHEDSALYAQRREANSAFGRLGVKKGSSTVIRSGGSKEGQKSRPTSSELNAEQLWQELEQLEGIPPAYSFKHFKRTQEYADQYRETYTYNQLREKSIHAVAAAKLRKSNIPRAKLVCYKSVNRSKKSGLTRSKLPPGTCKAQTSVMFDREEQSGIRWHMNPRLRDACDPHLSVNNPTPLELTTLGKMPIIRRSSPSIPSNTNGKYGGRGSNSLYPFQLQISTESRTVSTPYKRFPGSLLGQR